MQDRVPIRMSEEMSYLFEAQMYPRKNASKRAKRNARQNASKNVRRYVRYIMVIRLPKNDIPGTKRARMQEDIGRHIRMMPKECHYTCQQEKSEDNVQCRVPVRMSQDTPFEQQKYTR